MANKQGLKPDELYKVCDPDRFDFETTDALASTTALLGQDRVLEALDFSLGIDQDGYNLFALGPPGIGKHQVIRQYLDKRSEDETTPDDWCYVNNFEDERKPFALRLPAGVGAKLCEHLDQLIEELRVAIPAAFDSEEYRSRKDAIESSIRQVQQNAIDGLKEEAEKVGLTVVNTETGIAISPTRDGKPLSNDEFGELPEEEKGEIQVAVEKLQGELELAMAEVPRQLKAARKRIRQLNRQTAGFSTGPLIDDLRETYAELPQVISFLNGVHEDIADNVSVLRGTEDGNKDDASGESAAPHFADVVDRYRINLLVDHAESSGSPVIYEDQPSFQSLLGRIEQIAHMGALLTDFTLIKGGALHRANGGYLILDARNVLMRPMAWEALKRALRAKEIRIESPGESMGMATTIVLEPEPIPLNVRLILIGDRELYYTLCAADPDMRDLFKVPADFEEAIERSEQNMAHYAQLIGGLVQTHKTRPITKAGVARLVEHSSRLAGDSERLSLSIDGLRDILHEADYWAKAGEKDNIDRDGVQHAIDAQIRRSDRLHRRMHESIVRGTILLDTEGEKCGQVNGLSVLQLGNYAFGRPTRITARVRLGRGQLLDIEREVDLGGPLHSKGVLILSGYLGAHYAKDYPLALAASLVFEQSYGGVDGDSASSAELYALLSALSDIPIRQSLAVTGSVNQAGEVQAVGGVNEKIEGFYEVCLSRGLQGDQGVLIPQSNVKDLMLRHEVVAAVEEGEFNIYPVKNIDQGMELLTGITAGERNARGQFPATTINKRVEDRLSGFARQWQKFGGTRD
jgi:lon-related putative ATP-dependent protease